MFPPERQKGQIFPGKIPFAIFQAKGILSNYFTQLE
jgi:hypothetical protein